MTADEGLEEAALRARARFFGIVEEVAAKQRWLDISDEERQNWLEAVRAALAYCAREKMFLEVRFVYGDEAEARPESKTALERRPEQPGPVGWLNSSRTHWSNGASAAYYRDPRDLRDFLAGSALNALIAHGRNSNIARDAYVLADEMLRARGSKVCLVDAPVDVEALVELAEMVGLLADSSDPGAPCLCSTSDGWKKLGDLARKGLGR